MTHTQQLDRYLERIGYDGPFGVTEATLTALHRAHLLAIPYENLDIHLGRRLELGWRAAFSRLVASRRGGWCYEMNGLFAWALRRLGFSVRFLAGGVGWESDGIAARGSHLVLLVELGRPWLADVGFGDGFLEPLPLAAGRYRQGFLDFRLEHGGDWWIMHNHPRGGARSFNFSLEPCRLTDLAAKCHELQTSPASGFVRTTVCQRHTPDGLVTLRGAVLRVLTVEGSADRTLQSAAEFERVLIDRFGLEIPEAASLWPRVWDRHLAWKAAQPPGP